MKPKIFISFDLYGTLVDIKSSLINYFKEVSNGKINDKKATELYNLWNASNFGNIQSKRISFRNSVLETLAPILKKEGLSSKGNISLFLKYYSESKPFPEVFDVLSKLEKRYKLVIISNIDNDLLKKTKIGINFYKMITAEDCGYYYKPNKRIFEYALIKLNCSKDEILHVASSIRADVKGAVPLGWDMILVNRGNIVIDENTPKPLYEVSNLKEVLGLLCL